MTATDSNGRCPDCGEWVQIIVREAQRAEVPPHGCRARTCEYPGCRVTRFREEMVQAPSASGTARGTASSLSPKTSLRSNPHEGEADWTAISEIIGEQLLEIVKEVEAFHPFRLQRRT